MTLEEMKKGLKKNLVMMMLMIRMVMMNIIAIRK